MCKKEEILEEVVDMDRDGVESGIDCNDFDAAITTMKKDGSLSKLIAKWFDGRMVKY